MNTKSLGPLIASTPLLASGVTAHGQTVVFGKVSGTWTPAGNPLFSLTTTRSTRTERLRHDPLIAFDTSPRPQSPKATQMKAVAEAAGSLRALRREIIAADGRLLRDLYRTLDTPGANRLRDALAVPTPQLGPRATVCASVLPGLKLLSFA